MKHGTGSPSPQTVAHYNDCPVMTDGSQGAGIPASRVITDRPEEVQIATQDGMCPAFVFRPRGPSPFPAILFLLDGFGMRPCIMEMAQRLSDSGYLVLLPDLFYRNGRYDPIDVPAAFASGDTIANVRRHIGDALSNAMVAQDAAAFLTFLLEHPDAIGQRVGVVGYCMSGAMSLTIAARYPESVAAAACLHGGRLIAAEDDSPHRLVPSIRAEIYVGGAEHDRWCPPEMVEDFADLLAAADVRHCCEIYPGTRHGWTMRDLPMYDAAAAEKHWSTLVALFERALVARP